MKTAVSIPEDVFKGAERLARETKRSRSRLFSDALNSVTEAMNRACAELGTAKDEFASSAARRVLERSEWNRRCAWKVVTCALLKPIHPSAICHLTAEGLEWQDRKELP